MTFWQLRRNMFGAERRGLERRLSADWPFDIFAPIVVGPPKAIWPPVRRYPYDWAVQGV